MDAKQVGERLVAAIDVRDFDDVARCFAETASFRVLTPHRLREMTGGSEAAERFRSWFEAMEDFELLSSDVEVVADRVRVRFHTRGRDPEKGWQENEHTGYAEVENGLILALNVSCAGFRAVEP